MAEKSILEMSNDEILALISRNKILREEATQEKLVAKEKERTVKEGKEKSKKHKDTAMDILKQYMAGTELVKETKKMTKNDAQTIANDLLLQFAQDRKKKK